MEIGLNVIFFFVESCRVFSDYNPILVRKFEIVIISIPNNF